MKISVDTPYKVRSFWSASKADKGQNENIKSRILKLNDKLQQMLLWSNICTLLACVQMAFTIARTYSTFPGKHPVLLVSTLVIIILLFVLFLHFRWKSVAYDNDGFKQVSKIYLNCQVSKLNSQRRLSAGYLLVYALILTLSDVFFWQGFRDGLTLLFKATAPVSLITYSLGFYLMMNFTKQNCKLEILERQADQLGLMEINVQS